VGVSRSNRIVTETPTREKTGDKHTACLRERRGGGGGGGGGEDKEREAEAAEEERLYLLSETHEAERREHTQELFCSSIYETPHENTKLQIDDL